MEKHTLMHIAAILVGVWILVGGWACASRQTSSSGSEGQSTTAKDKGAVETVQPPQMATVTPPDSGTATVPSSRRAEEAPAPDTRASQFTSSAPPSSLPSTGSQHGGHTDVAGLGDIFFDFDRYDIRKDSEAVLQGNAVWLRREATRSFVIEGHCDERGTLAYNLVLGEKRAKSAKRYLQELGIQASRIRTTSYGEVRPFCKEHNEGCWQKNRRAHFAVQ